MDYSTSQAIPLLAAKGIHVGPSAIRRYEKLGLFPMRKTPRGEILLSDEDIERFVAFKRQRCAAQHRARQAAIRAAHVARRAQRRSVFA